MSSIKVILADDHKVIRQGLKALLSRLADFDVVGEAGNGRELLDLTARLTPDVVVTDLMMPDMGGLEAIQQIRARFRAIQVVVLSMHANPAFAIQALRNGALGYVLKDSDTSELVQAVRAAALGHRYIDAALADQVMLRLIQPGDYATQSDPYQLLTGREREILQLVTEGHTNAEMALRLTVSLRTVETHRANLMRKLDLHSQADLIRYALQHGFSDLNE